MEKRDISIIISGVFFILFLLFVLFRPDLNLEKISGKTIGEGVLPRDKLVLRYDFEEGSGNTVNDLTGKGHTGTITGTTQVVTGKYGYGLLFPGGSNYLTLQSADDIKGGQDLSVVLWVKVDGSMPSLVYKGDSSGNNIDYNLSYDSVTKKFGCEVKNSNLKAVIISDSISDETKWYHVVCVLDKTAANLKLYIDGVPKTVAVSDSLTFASTTNSIYIGVDSKGRLDSFRIYNKVLSDSEINNLFSASIPIVGPGPTDGLIAFWPLNDGSGSKVKELVNGWDGDITGATWTTDTKPGSTTTENVLNFRGADAGANADMVYISLFNIKSNPPTKVSVAYWINVDWSKTGTTISDAGQSSTSGFLWLISGGLSYSNGTSAPTFYPNYGGLQSNVWHHMVAVIDYGADTAEFYSDGNLVTKLDIPGAIPPDSDRLYLGTYSPTHPSRTYGKLSDVRIYNRLLSQQEIKSFIPGYTPPPQFPYGSIDLTNSLSNISDNINGGVKGNISFIVSDSGKKIDNNSYINLTLSKTGFESSKKVYINQIMNSLNVAGTNYNNDYDLGGYSSAIGYNGGTYSIDSSIFGLNSVSGSGSYNLSLTFVVTNGNKYSKSKIVTRTNSAPILKAVIPNLTWAKNSNNFIDLNNYFSDPDNDNLTYSTVGTTGSITIAISGAKVNLTQPLNYVGSYIIRFRANDFYNATESNLVVLNVSASFVGNQTCIPAWQSGNWSECSIDGLQIRTIVDVNNCNVDTGKPADNQSCVYTPVGEGGEGVPTQGGSTTGPQTGLKEKPTKKTESSIFSSKLFLSGLILFIFAGVIVGIYFIRRQRGMGVTEEIVEKPEFKEKTVGVQKVEVQKFKPVYEEAQNVKEMKDYINNALNQGADMNSIKDNLIKAGWNKDDVNNASNFITVERFAKSRISSMSKDQIKNLLISKGWNRQLVEKVLAGL